MKLLHEVCDLIKTGKTPPSTVQEYFDGDLDWFTPGDFNGIKYLSSSARKISQKALDDKKASLFPKDSILLNCIGDIGKVGIIKATASSNQQITCLKPKSTLDVNYLYYWIVKNKPTLENLSNSAVVPILNNKQLGSVKIPVPPLATQKKIAAILDAADAHRQKTKQLLAKYDELAQSIFLDMFGDPGKNNFNYVEYSMNQIASKITDGDHATPQRTESGYKLLSCRNVKNSFIDFDAGLDYVGQSEYDRMSKRCNPQLGDILISCSGTIGRTTVVKIDEPFVLVRSAALIKPKRELVNSLYLEKYLQTPFMQAVMIRKANTSSQSNLFTGPIKSLPVLLPPMSLQNEFAEKVKLIEKMSKKVILAISDSESLFNSILQKAFKGGLVD